MTLIRPSIEENLLVILVNQLSLAQPDNPWGHPTAGSGRSSCISLGRNVLYPLQSQTAIARILQILSVTSLRKAFREANITLAFIQYLHSSTLKSANLCHSLYRRRSWTILNILTTRIHNKFSLVLGKASAVLLDLQYLH